MKWISVKDKMPQHDQDVLVLTTEEDIYVSIFFNDPDEGFYVPCNLKCSLCNHFFNLTTNNVTHWMSLPNTPKDKYCFELKNSWNVDLIVEDKE